MKNKGVIGTIISGFTILVVIGIFLAVLNQFNGDLTAMLEWFLSFCWTIISSVRDIFSNWDTFKGLF